MALFSRFIGPKAGLDPEAQEQQRLSQAELAAGRLPLSAQERLTASRDDGVFTSALSTRDLVAVRAAVYEVVGQAFGTATFTLNRQQAYYQNNIHGLSYGTGGGFGGGFGAYGGQGQPAEMRGFHTGEVAARRTAMSRMLAECAALGGEGVIGVRSLRAGQVANSIYEFTVVGTSVRRQATSVRRQGAAGSRLGDDGRPAADPDRAPFATTLIPADFAMLLRGGWQPREVLFELVRYSIHGGAFALGGGIGPFSSRSWQNVELGAPTTLMEYGRAAVRQRLDRRVRASGASGMILDELQTRLEHGECVAMQTATDFYLDVEAMGNALVRVRPPARTVAPGGGRPGLEITPVVRLDG